MLLVAAFDPWAVGNGSSLRARRWCDALQLAAGSFDAVVVPVVASDAASPYRRLVLPDDAAKVRNAALLLQPRWRDWMVRTAPLPPLAERAPAWMGRELLTGLPWRPDLVVAFKLAVAPMAADLAMECEVPLVVDLDDDEVALAQLDGNSHAPALERLQRGVGELAGVLTVASPVDAEAVRERVAAPVHVVPNCVDVPEPCPEPGEPGGALYVANFGYAPNREAADWFRSQVLPLVRGLRELAVVGAGGERVGFGGVARAHGRVAQLDPFYREASVVRGTSTTVSARWWRRWPTVAPWSPPPSVPGGWGWCLASTRWSATTHASSPTTWAVSWRTPTTPRRWAPAAERWWRRATPRRPERRPWPVPPRPPWGADAARRTPRCH